MLQILFFIISLLSISSLYAPCGCNNKANPALGQRSAQESTEYITICPRENTAFTITLESNPSTGYSWDLENPVDQEFITNYSHQYLQSQLPKPGAPGIDQWTFTVGSTYGKTTIVLAYKRWWEQGSKPIKRHVIEVDIKCPKE